MIKILAVLHFIHNNYEQEKRYCLELESDTKPKSLQPWGDCRHIASTRQIKKALGELRHCRKIIKLAFTI